MDWFSTLAIWLWVGLGAAALGGGLWIARTPWRRLLRQAEQDPLAKALPSSWLRPPRIEIKQGEYRGRFGLSIDTQSSRTLWRFEVEGVQLATHLSFRVQKVALVKRLLERQLSNVKVGPASNPLSGLRVSASDDDHMRAVLRHDSVQQSFAALFAAYPFLHHIDLDESGVLRCECPTRERSYEAGRHGIMLLLDLVRQLDENRLSPRELSLHRHVLLTGSGARSGQPIGVGSVSSADE